MMKLPSMDAARVRHPKVRCASLDRWAQAAPVGGRDQHQAARPERAEQPGEHGRVGNVRHKELVQREHGRLGRNLRPRRAPSTPQGAVMIHMKIKNPES